MRKIWLKWRFKRLYIRIQTYEGYGCGNHLQAYIDNTYYNLLISFNKTADKLSKIDPNCPTFRYKTR